MDTLRMIDVPSERDSLLLREYQPLSVRIRSAIERAVAWVEDDAESYVTSLLDRLGGPRRPTPT